MDETKLAAHVVRWLEEQHWDVYQEVQFGPMGARADIVAVRSGKLWIIECKTSLTFTVLEQASTWPAHFRSIAIPTRRDGGRGIAYRIARDYLRLGIIEVGDTIYGGPVNERVSPPVMREHHKAAKELIASLHEEQKHMLAAGSNGGGYWTPYRHTMDCVRNFIRANPGCTLKEIMDNTDHHYRTNATARTCIREALAKWESKWCETRADERGTFRYYLRSR